MCEEIGSVNIICGLILISTLILSVCYYFYLIRKHNKILKIFRETVRVGDIFYIVRDDGTVEMFKLSIITDDFIAYYTIRGKLEYLDLCYIESPLYHIDRLKTDDRITYDSVLFNSMIDKFSNTKVYKNIKVETELYYELCDYGMIKDDILIK